MMLSISQKKFVNSLKQKKFRTEHNSFIIEGVKMLEELLHSDYEVETIYATSLWINNNSGVDCIEISVKELNSISSLKTPNEVLAVVQQKEVQLIDLPSQLNIALDKIQDPGNFGTIIRTADWFGIQNIICSDNSVDVYNPKVLQATMGSFFRMNIIYTDLSKFLSENKELTVYGALLNGENVYQKELNSKGSILLMGNESKGISEELIPFITDKISIPKFGNAESLNVATATAIFCSEYKRV
ncbi:MAG: RNA methyltransferase [Flavobacteriales bacterium]|nr:MAG: RNA methyltransferase [Flavobacteriales bacterium]